MNIFAIHTNPVISARELHDKHVVKMILESTQMLANALGDIYGSGERPLLTKRHKTKFYHLTLLTKVPQVLIAERVFGWDPLGRIQFSTKGYHSHPCTVWVRASEENLVWLITHALALCCEYRSRYGKTHSLHRELQKLSKLFNLSKWKEVSSFARAMPPELKDNKDISDSEAYRIYLRDHKPFYQKEWKRSVKPLWAHPIDKNDYRLQTRV